MKTVLVTGSCGYIASQLIYDLLQSGYQVRAMDNLYKGSYNTLIPFIINPSFEFIYGDVNVEDDVKAAYEDVDYCVHLAALVGAPLCKKYPEIAKMTNIGGTENMVKHKPPHVKMIMMSTGSIYSNKGGNCTEEETDLQPCSLYGSSKLAAEKICLGANNVKTYRLSTLFGVSHSTVRANLLVNTLVFEALTNRNLVIFEGHAKRSFIHLRDVTKAIKFGLENFDNLSYNLYNISNSELNFSKKALAELISQETSCGLTIVDNITDLDARDSFVDCSRFYATSWRPQIGILEGVRELKKLTPLLRQWDYYL